MMDKPNPRPTQALVSIYLRNTYVAQLNLLGCMKMTDIEIQALQNTQVTKQHLSDEREDFRKDITANVH